MCNVLRSTGIYGDLSFGSARKFITHRDGCFTDKTNEDRLQVRIPVKKVFDLAEHQVKATYGIDYILTLKRHKDDSVISRNVATVVGITIFE